MARIRVQHLSGGYMKIWKSPAMQAEVDAAGEKIAANANAGYSQPWFKYYPKRGRYTALGSVSATGPTGDYYEARDGALTKAVHA